MQSTITSSSAWCLIVAILRSSTAAAFISKRLPIHCVWGTSTSSMNPSSDELTNICYSVAPADRFQLCRRNHSVQQRKDVSSSLVALSAASTSSSPLLVHQHSDNDQQPISQALCNDDNDDVDINCIKQKLELFLDSKNVNDFITNMINKIDSKVREAHETDLHFCSSFPSEESINGDKVRGSVRLHVPSYEMINISGQAKGKCSYLAIRTNDEDNPILSQQSISTIINAAESIWFDIKISDDDDHNSGVEEKETKSRFTYQRKGNYEAHLVDLAKSVDDNIHTIMNDALMNRIYPMVRQAFQNDIPDINDIEFCVYDSLVIRYNATEAMMMANNGNEHQSSDDRSSDDILIMDPPPTFVGAGQPLHRDLGIVSVNIMLNSDEDFIGGGTFFEDQMRSSLAMTKGQQEQDKEEEGDTADVKPLKPTGIGQCLAHLSSRRHAGAGTKRGVRDILVIFLSAKTRDSSNNYAPPIMEKSARMKSTARNFAEQYNEDEALLHRIVSHKLAIDNVPTDGEAWHYLAMALREYATLKENQNLDESRTRAKLAISCLSVALRLTPCDGRLCSNIGLAHETLYRLNAPDNGEVNNDFQIYSEREQNYISSFYERSLQLHSISRGVGCDVNFDLDQAYLNYGLFLSKQDRFRDAVNILSHFDGMESTMQTITDPNHLRVIFDGNRLYHFCAKNMA